MRKALDLGCTFFDSTEGYGAAAAGPTRMRCKHALGAALELAAAAERFHGKPLRSRKCGRPCGWVATGIATETPRAAQRSPFLNL